MPTTRQKPIILALTYWTLRHKSMTPRLLNNFDAPTRLPASQPAAVSLPPSQRVRCRRSLTSLSISVLEPCGEMTEDRCLVR